MIRASGSRYTRRHRACEAKSCAKSKCPSRRPPTGVQHNRVRGSPGCRFNLAEVLTYASTNVSAVIEWRAQHYRSEGQLLLRPRCSYSWAEAFDFHLVRRAPARVFPTEALPGRDPRLGSPSQSSPSPIKPAISGLRMGHFGLQDGADAALY
jgi:hypothetical protein